MKNTIKKLVFPVFIAIFMLSCNEDDSLPSTYSPEETITSPENIDIQGLYVLNEGNMGSNKASLDYFDYSTGVFSNNIYSKVNSTVTYSLGDVGNDIQIYGSKMYAVINVSNYIEVMDAKTAKHLGEIQIPNCRYIAFDKGYAYVTSYAGPVSIDPNAPPGYVVKVDTATLQIVNKEVVGYQPDELVVANNKLYVANSGGYRVPNYDNTVSVIDLNTFKEIKKIEVAINLWRIRKDKNNKLWVTSRGDYGKNPPRTFILNPDTDTVEKEVNAVVSDMSFFDDKMYYYGYAWTAQGATTHYGIIDINDQEVVSDQFIKNGIEKDIVIPYAITVNPVNGDIFIADATNYVTSGRLHCFDKDGYFKWKATTGDIPGHFTFLWK
ncbi:MAG: YncE family protein [Flavobacteriaceae bacterium]|jgi:YVTN family beta-propeller protein|nr:YncE family protein [Flavobacteriaceae bacterium]